MTIKQHNEAIQDTQDLLNEIQETDKELAQDMPIDEATKLAISSINSGANRTEAKDSVKQFLRTWVLENKTGVIGWQIAVAQQDAIKKTKARAGIS